MIDPANSNVLYNQILHGWTGERTSDREAIEKWRQFVQESPSVQRRYLLARMFIFSGQGSEALKILKDISKEIEANAIRTAEQMAERETAGRCLLADSKEVKGLSVSLKGDLLVSYGKDSGAKVWNLPD
ncbi:hypothetical protein SDC9_208390 [bioreactor metagenome]|uniref:Uncharacterized protein n=1 Tax=bioreactor metagenome TaxID=1076179 RepID=A0A645JDB2_9ZZZZ